MTPLNGKPLQRVHHRRRGPALLAAVGLVLGGVMLAGVGGGASATGAESASLAKANSSTKTKTTKSRSKKSRTKTRTKTKTTKTTSTTLVPTTTTTTTIPTTTTTIPTTTTTTTTTRTTTTSTTTTSTRPVVANDGTGMYWTIQAAIDAVPSTNSRPVVITIKPGTYRGVVTVDKPYVTLQGLGSSPSDVVIVENHSADNYGTFNSATVFVKGANFTATNLTFANDFDENSNSTNQDQAVALHLNADKTVLRNVRLLGDQDTLLVNTYARAYVVDSYVEGMVDFIFGNGVAVFDRCTIHQKRAAAAPITAARTDSSWTYGFLIYKSTITGVAANGTQLGRPWGQGAQVLYRECYLDWTIATSQPWIDMSPAYWKSARFLEYRNTGPGATYNSNRPQLSDSLAWNYTPQRYLAGSDGWNPVG